MKLIKLYSGLLCHLLGHYFLYNFPNMPNKRICKRCYKKEKWNNDFNKWGGTFSDKRSDKELVSIWFLKY